MLPLTLILPKIELHPYCCTSFGCNRAPCFDEMSMPQLIRFNSSQYHFYFSDKLKLQDYVDSTLKNTANFQFKTIFGGY